ncbi:M20/M25/M40 family metallo-hydrolase [bacterium]|nr:M20/M25/M40 family metallo-hydrolase [bacterium]
MMGANPAPADAVDLLARLVRQKSVTGDTAQIQILVQRWLAERGVESINTKDGLVARVGRGGPTLLFLSHLDTVPPGQGWTFDPFSGDQADGLLRGRGATDAKGSASAMCAALARLAARPDLPGRIVMFLSANEEGDVPCASYALKNLGPFDGAVIGEPTDMMVGVAQRGLLVLRLTAESEQAHAAHSQKPSSAFLLAEDLVRVCAIPFGRTDPDLGTVKVTPVRLTAGVADNVTPPEASAMLDIRTIPAYAHEEVKALVTDACRHCRVEQVGIDWPPVATPREHRLFSIAQRLSGRGTVAGAAASDWAFLGDTPAVKIGPGISSVSHRPDETVPVRDVFASVDVYENIAMEFFVEI